MLSNNQSKLIRYYKNCKNTIKFIIIYCSHTKNIIQLFFLGLPLPLLLATYIPFTNFNASVFSLPCPL